MIQVFKPWIDEREEEVVTETFPDVTYVRAPKRACPRHSGFWYCAKCVSEYLEEQSLVDFPIPMRGCGEFFGTKVCGKTHLGYKWCPTCQADNRAKPHPHIGEFEIIGEVQADEPYEETVT